MTLSDLQTLVSVWVDDPSNGYFTLPILNVFINNAQRETQKKLLEAGQNYYTKTQYSSTVQYQQEYSLPTNFIKLQRFYLVVSGTAPNESQQTLEYITEGESDLIPPGQGLPSAYNIRKNSFLLYPIPDNVYTMRMDFADLVTDMSSSSDVPDCPRQYDEYIAVLSTIDCLLRDGRDASQFLEKKRFYEELMRQTAQARNEDSPRHIRQTNSEGFDNLF